jgi:1-acyl-sn-glycerol-3-phosphate acyltransferase
VRVEGARAVDRSQPYVIIANHQSFADILVLYATYLPFKWVSKSTVFNVPFIGWHMYLNRYVSLVRGDKASVEKMAADCKRWLARGVSVLIFPEGTRSKDGRLGPFKPGAFRIAREAGVKILPVVVEGTATTLPKHGIVIRGRSRCRVRVLPPVDPAPFESHEAAAEDLHNIMKSHMNQPA